MGVRAFLRALMYVWTSLSTSPSNRGRPRRLLAILVTLGTSPGRFSLVAFFNSSKYRFLKARTVLSPKPPSKSSLNFFTATALPFSAAYLPIVAL